MDYTKPKIKQQTVNLSVGDKFTPKSIEVKLSKTYPGRMYGMIRSKYGNVLRTSSPNICVILSEIDTDPTDVFEVYEDETRNGYPVLSLKSSNPNTQEKIEKVFF